MQSGAMHAAMHESQKGLPKVKMGKAEAALYIAVGFALGSGRFLPSKKVLQPKCTGALVNLPGVDEARA